MVTKRTTERKRFWVPWHREVSLAYGYSVGLEARDHDLAIHLQSAKDRNVVVRHRFARSPAEAGSGVARVIVKRDKRRGRPAAAHGTQGADPPA